MKLKDIHPLDQIFSHQDCDEAKTMRHFNASAITRAIVQGKINPYPAKDLNLYPELVQGIRDNHGIEPDHLERIDNKLHHPILIAVFGPLEDPASQNLVIDGSHRVVRRWDKGMRTVDAFMLTPDQWEPYLIEDYDEDQLLSLPELLEYMARKPSRSL